MHEHPDFASDRPDWQDEGIDVVSEVLDAAHLTTGVYGTLELGAPWLVRAPARPDLSFYVVARGGGWIELDEGGEGAVALSAGDAVLLPRGSAHSLRDSQPRHASGTEADLACCPGPWIGEKPRFGGDGPRTELVTGHFAFSGGASRNPLLETLPPLIHLPAHVVGSHPQLAGVVPLILHESARPGPGSTIVLARLADLLLIHAMRYWIGTAGGDGCGLRAVADASIGKALRLMHARASEPWTVDRLASAVAMSRSAFAARFTRLVGEPPLQYLARWRMTQAARLLASRDVTVPAVAERVGYANPVAFAKAFSRFHGVGPGAFRKSAG